MICTKCGQQIPDDSAVCPVCGEPLAPRPRRRAGSPIKGIFITWPNFILSAVVLAAFFCSVLPLFIAEDGWHSAFTSNTLSYGWGFLAGKIFSFVALFFFPFCLASYLVDFNRIFKRFPIRVTLITTALYFLPYGLAMLIELITALVTGRMPTLWLILAFVFWALGIAGVFLRGFLNEAFRKGKRRPAPAPQEEEAEPVEEEAEPKIEE